MNPVGRESSGTICTGIIGQLQVYKQSMYAA